MSDNRKSGINWGIAGGAVAALATVSPPAAAAAGVVLGLHEAYNWWKDQDQGDEGPEKAQ